MPISKHIDKVRDDFGVKVYNYAKGSLEGLSIEDRDIQKYKKVAAFFSRMFSKEQLTNEKYVEGIYNLCVLMNGLGTKDYTQEQILTYVNQYIEKGLLPESFKEDLQELLFAELSDVPVEELNARELAKPKFKLVLDELTAQEQKVKIPTKINTKKKPTAADIETFRANVNSLINKVYEDDSGAYTDRFQGIVGKDKVPVKTRLGELKEQGYDITTAEGLLSLIAKTCSQSQLIDDRIQECAAKLFFLLILPAGQYFPLDVNKVVQGYIGEGILPLDFMSKLKKVIKSKGLTEGEQKAKAVLNDRLDLSAKAKKKSKKGEKKVSKMGAKKVSKKEAEETIFREGSEANIESLKKRYASFIRTERLFQVETTDASELAIKNLEKFLPEALAELLTEKELNNALGDRNSIHFTHAVLLIQYMIALSLDPEMSSAVAESFPEMVRRGDFSGLGIKDGKSAQKILGGLSKIPGFGNFTVLAGTLKKSKAKPSSSNDKYISEKMKGVKEDEKAMTRRVVLAFSAALEGSLEGRVATEISKEERSLARIPVSSSNLIEITNAIFPEGNGVFGSVSRIQADVLKGRVPEVYGFMKHYCKLSGKNIFEAMGVTPEDVKVALRNNIENNSNVATFIQFVRHVNLILKAQESLNPSRKQTLSSFMLSNPAFFPDEASRVAFDRIMHSVQKKYQYQDVFYKDARDKMVQTETPKLEKWLKEQGVSAAAIKDSRRHFAEGDQWFDSISSAMMVFDKFSEQIEGSGKKEEILLKIRTTGDLETDPKVRALEITLKGLFDGDSISDDIDSLMSSIQDVMKFYPGFYELAIEELIDGVTESMISGMADSLKVRKGTGYQKALKLETLKYILSGVSTIDELSQHLDKMGEDELTAILKSIKSTSKEGIISEVLAEMEEYTKYDEVSPETAAPKAKSSRPKSRHSIKMEERLQELPSEIKETLRTRCDNDDQYSELVERLGKEYSKYPKLTSAQETAMFTRLVQNENLENVEVMLFEAYLTAVEKMDPGSVKDYITNHFDKRESYILYAGAVPSGALGEPLYADATPVSGGPAADRVDVDSDAVIIPSSMAMGQFPNYDEATPVDGGPASHSHYDEIGLDNINDMKKTLEELGIWKEISEKYSTLHQGVIEGLLRSAFFEKEQYSKFPSTEVEKQFYLSLFLDNDKPRGSYEIGSLFFKVYLKTVYPKFGEAQIEQLAGNFSTPEARIEFIKSLAKDSKAVSTSRTGLPYQTVRNQLKELGIMEEIETVYAKNPKELNNKLGELSKIVRQYSALDSATKAKIFKEALIVKGGIPKDPVELLAFGRFLEYVDGLKTSAERSGVRRACPTSEDRASYVLQTLQQKGLVKNSAQAAVSRMQETIDPSQYDFVRKSIFPQRSVAYKTSELEQRVKPVSDMLGKSVKSLYKGKEDVYLLRLRQLQKMADELPAKADEQDSVYRFAMVATDRSGSEVAITTNMPPELRYLHAWLRQSGIEYGKGSDGNKHGKVSELIKILANGPYGNDMQQVTRQFVDQLKAAKGDVAKTQEVFDETYTRLTTQSPNNKPDFE